MIPDKLAAVLKKQKYRFAGKNQHSLVKICQYTKDSIIKGSWCYKNQFYGIKSNRCLQCTVVPFCFNKCVFCWRAQPGEIEVDMDSIKIDKWDDPEEIIEEMILAQRKLLSGLGGHPHADKKLWIEAQDPKHVALSVLGEPIVYPKMPELLKAFHKRGMSTFIVTAGGSPSAIENLINNKTLPTQLYLSMSSYDKESFNLIVRPNSPDGWERYLASLKLLKEAGKFTRTVIRMTIIKDSNMAHPEKYAELIKMGNPDYVEVKAYMALGFSRNRIGPLGMPLHDEIVEFAKKLAKETGYIYTDEHKPSRIVLLCRDEKAKKNRIIDFSKIK